MQPAMEVFGKHEPAFLKYILPFFCSESVFRDKFVIYI